jgi:TRAP-type C4-dicarboxylate transport system permease small subunit
MLFIPEGPPGAAPIRWLSNLVDLLIFILGAVMVGIVFFNVLIHFFRFDIAMTTELCEFMMTWVTFLGAAAAVRRGAHMTITEFIDKLTGKKRFIADGFVQCFSAAVLAVCVWYGVNVVNLNWGNVLTVLYWPKATQYMALPAGCGLALIFTVYDLYLIGRGVPREERYGGGE